MDAGLHTPEEFLALCRERKSVRSFSDKSVSAEDIEYIKAVAATSPFASGKKNWGLKVIGDREKIGAMAEAVSERSRALAAGMREDHAAGFLRYAANFCIFTAAPVVLIPTFRVQPALSIMTGGAPGIAGFERDNHLKSISCVAMLILLAAKARGLGACYMTGPLLAGEELGRIITLNPAHEIGALIPVGHPND